ncbi:MAG TPA: response regulator [Bacteroidia bacterium]|nr:response regulator [Bacteroidia bacterium]
MNTSIHKNSKNRKFLPQEFTVFIVDDDAFYLSALAFRLMKTIHDHNVKIFCYSSGEECVQNLGLHPSLVILDYYLSSGQQAAMSGMDVMRRIKSVYPHVPVIMLSGQHSMSVALNTLREGAYTYVIKDKLAPYSIEKIISRFVSGRSAAVH